MSDQIFRILLAKLKEMRPEQSEALNVDSAADLTLEAMDFDSLDTLKLAMDLEDALGMTIETVNFPDTWTLAQLASRLNELKSRASVFS